MRIKTPLVFGGGSPVIVINDCERLLDAYLSVFSQLRADVMHLEQEFLSKIIYKKFASIAQKYPLAIW